MMWNNTRNILILKCIYLFFFFKALRCWEVITEVLLRFSTATVTLKAVSLPAFTGIFRQTEDWYEFLYECTAPTLSLNSETAEIPGTSMEMNVQCKIDSNRKHHLHRHLQYYQSGCTDVKCTSLALFMQQQTCLEKYLSYFTSTTRKMLSPKHRL